MITAPIALMAPIASGQFQDSEVNIQVECNSDLNIEVNSEDGGCNDADVDGSANLACGGCPQWGSNVGAHHEHGVMGLCAVDNF